MVEKVEEGINIKEDNIVGLSVEPISSHSIEVKEYVKVKVGSDGQTPNEMNDKENVAGTMVFKKNNPNTIAFRISKI